MTEVFRTDEELLAATLQILANHREYDLSSKLAMLQAADVIEKLVREVERLLARIERLRKEVQTHELECSHFHPRQRLQIGDLGGY